MAGWIGLYASSFGNLATESGTRVVAAVHPSIPLWVSAVSVLIAAIGVCLAHQRGKEARLLASEANAIAGEARGDAERNSRSLRRLSIRLERLRGFEEHLQKLRVHRKGFLDSLAAIEGVGSGDETENGDDVVQRSRMLSRSFRTAMEHYGESWDVFQVVKNDLDEDTVAALETGMRQASSLFTESFSAAQVAAVAVAHGRVLDSLRDAAEAGLARLRGRVDEAVSGSVDEGEGAGRAS